MYLILITIYHTIHELDAGPSRRINQADASDSNIPRRAQIARNQRRNAPQQQTTSQDSDESDDDSNRPNPFADAKIGTKKRAKLEAKAERQRLRESEQIAREVRFKFKVIMKNEHRNKFRWNV